MSPEFFAIAQDSPEWKTLSGNIRDLEAQAIKAFGMDETRRLLAQLGPDDDASIQAQLGKEQ
jgi:hypothetical protein